MYNCNTSELILACRNGKAAAQQAIYQRYSRKMLSICLRFATDAMEAEDILMEGFCKVFLKIDTYNGEGSFEGWIRRIMLNSALAVYQKNRKKIRTISYQDIPLNLEPCVYEFSHDTDYLKNAIQTLPTNQRKAFNRYTVEGYSHKEVAEELNISVAQSKMYVFRARKSLQQKLTRHTTKRLRNAAV